MKAISRYILLIVILTGCNRPVYKNHTQSNIVTDTVATAPLPEIVPDTVVKISKPFNLNNTRCYWRHEITTDDELIIKLLEHKTNEILLEHFSFIYVKPDYEALYYFDEINKDCFANVNFDGFTDILIKFQGDGPINDAVDIFLFNKENKIYNHSADLSDNRIGKIDAKNKKFITTNTSRHGSDSTIHYFNNTGKVIARETFSSYNTTEDTIWLEHKTYQKTVNGEVIIENHTTDTIR